MNVQAMTVARAMAYCVKYTIIHLTMGYRKFCNQIGVVHFRIWEVYFLFDSNLGSILINSGTIGKKVMWIKQDFDSFVETPSPKPLIMPLCFVKHAILMRNGIQPHASNIVQQEPVGLWISNNIEIFMKYSPLTLKCYKQSTRPCISHKLQEISYRDTIF